MAAHNIVGVDPHRATLTATVLDSRGGELGHAHFPNTHEGHASGLAWAAGFGPADRWGIEGASGLGRCLAEFLVRAGCDVRDVPPHKSSARQRSRHKGKSDRLDSRRIAAETQANPRLARAFKHAVPATPDSLRERMALWHNARKSLTKIRVQLLGELDALVQDLPEELRAQLRPAKTVSARVNSLRRLDASAVADPTVLLRLRLIEHRVELLRDVLGQDRAATAELATLVDEANSTLTGLVGIAHRLSTGVAAHARLVVDLARSRLEAELDHGDMVDRGVEPPVAPTREAVPHRHVAALAGAGRDRRSAVEAGEAGLGEAPDVADLDEDLRRGARRDVALEDDQTTKEVERAKTVLLAS